MSGDTDKITFAGLVAAFARDERGATAIEYGILASMIMVALVGMATLADVSSAQNRVYGLLTNAMR